MQQPNVRREYKQNDLFRRGPDSRLNACVGMNGGPYDFDDYAVGYFYAGEHVVDALVANSAWVDITIYPLVFVYRHGIELSLKYLSLNLPRLWNETETLKLTHKLLDNWQVVKPYLGRERAFDPEGKLLPTVDRVLKDFLEIDPSGETFRYPTDRKGNMTLRDTTLVNVEVFADAMKTASEAFRYWMWQADELWTSKCEGS